MFNRRAKKKRSPPANNCSEVNTLEVICLSLYLMRNIDQEAVENQKSANFFTLTYTEAEH